MKRRNKIICFFIFCAGIIFSQSSYVKNFGRLSPPEKKWAVFHPFCALRVKRLTKEALLVVSDVKEKKLLDQFENGGKLDAFRHIFTMAFLTQKIPVRKLRKLGKAHEKGNYLQFKKGGLENGELPDSLSCEMDLRNNETGFLIGEANKKLNPDSLREVVVIKINSGAAYYMKRNEKGNYVSCEGKEILPEEWKGKWFVPKCLIQTGR